VEFPGFDVGNRVIGLQSRQFSERFELDEVRVAVALGGSTQVEIPATGDELGSFHGDRPVTGVRQPTSVECRANFGWSGSICVDEWESVFDDKPTVGDTGMGPHRGVGIRLVSVGIGGVSSQRNNASSADRKLVIVHGATSTACSPRLVKMCERTTFLSLRATARVCSIVAVSPAPCVSAMPSVVSEIDTGSSSGS
jgi:hypothetical protein